MNIKSSERKKKTVKKIVRVVRSGGGWGKKIIRRIHDGGASRSCIHLIP